MKEKVFLSWSWVDQEVLTLSEIVKDSVSEFTYISGVPRGGLIPGVYLSHKLGIRYIPYGDAKQLPLTVRNKILVVDDICDSGVTLVEASELGFKTASLAMRYSSIFIPDFYSSKIENDAWLVFPWEDADGKTVQDYLG